MENNPISRSVKNLQQLYTVLIGVSLAYGIDHIINLSGDKFPVYIERLPLFFVYLAFVIPVYHGAMRHLDVSYIENINKKPLALIFDFIILFIEGCFFLLLSGLVQFSYKFIYVLFLLLLIDIVWAGIAFFGFTSDKTEKRAVATWGLMNLITLALLVVGFLFFDCVDKSKNPVEFYIKIYVLIIMLIRSTFDYVLCWEFYYPRRKRKK
jgi:hypothetical protein